MFVGCLLADAVCCVTAGDARLCQHGQGAAKDAADATHSLPRSHHHPVDLEGLGAAPQVAPCLGGTYGAETAPGSCRNPAAGEALSRQAMHMCTQTCSCLLRSYTS